jgi:hypothetical protein
MEAANLNLEEQLISKKDLLDEADISYGQLYRWKRKNLIPEDWFIRKSTFTGQETFFPREKILDRISKIKQFKNDISLDDLADVFSPQNHKILMTKTELLERNIVTETLLSLYFNDVGVKETFEFDAILHLYLLNTILSDGQVGLDEAKQVHHTLHQHHAIVKQQNGVDLLLGRKMGIAIVVLTENAANVFLDDQTKVIVRISIERLAEELKNLLLLGGA